MFVQKPIDSCTSKCAVTPLPPPKPYSSFRGSPVLGLPSGGGGGGQREGGGVKDLANDLVLAPSP